MGFKKIMMEELKTSSSLNFIGVPLAKVKNLDLVKSIKPDQLNLSRSTDLLSKIMIINEEFIEYTYQFDRKRKTAEGFGNLSVINNSDKDRIWDAILQYSGTHYNDLELENELTLGIFEPKTQKNIKYDLVNTNELPDIIKVEEIIEVLNGVIDGDSSKDSSLETSNYNKSKNFFLFGGKENFVKISIVVENVSSFHIEDIKLKKHYPKEFNNVEVKNAMHRDFKVTKNYLEWSLINLKPGEKSSITLLVKILPIKKQMVKSGKIDLTCFIKEHSISGLKLNDFSAFSYALHAINKVEKEDKPNHWQCYLLFENQSGFTMKLKSIIVLDKNKSKEFVNLDFETSSNGSIIHSGGRFDTKKWEVDDDLEPIFFREIEYSVLYNFEKKSNISIQIDDSVFEIVDVQLEKKISETEVKSFEESTVGNIVTVKNVGAVPIKAIVVREAIPQDFLPVADVSHYKISNNAGQILDENVVVNIVPPDEDTSKEHVLELQINLNNNQLNYLVGVNDSLTIKYPIKAITPNNKTAYNFPLEVSSYYSKYKGQVEREHEEYFVINNKLLEEKAPVINVLHKRRNLVIGKQIYPGRSSEEFAISIVVRNKSNVRLNDISVSDTFPDSFQLISSNTKHELKDIDNKHAISFTISDLHPYQETEIMYYLKNQGGQKQSKLESFFYG